jgi:hypothetical protein
MCVFEYGILFKIKSRRSWFRRLGNSTPPGRIFVNFIITLEEYKTSIECFFYFNVSVVESAITAVLRTVLAPPAVDSLYGEHLALEWKAGLQNYALRRKIRYKLNFCKVASLKYYFL